MAMTQEDLRAELRRVWRAYFNPHTERVMGWRLWVEYPWPGAGPQFYARHTGGQRGGPGTNLQAAVEGLCETILAAR